MFELLPYGATIDLKCTSCSKKGELINNYISSTNYSTITEDIGKNNCYFLESSQEPVTMTYSYTKKNGILVGIDTNLTIVSSNFGSNGSGSFTITNEGFNSDEQEQTSNPVVINTKKDVKEYVGRGYVTIGSNFFPSYIFGTVTKWEFRDPVDQTTVVNYDEKIGDTYYFNSYEQIMIYVWSTNVPNGTGRIYNLQGVEKYCYIPIDNSDNIDKILDKNNSTISSNLYTIEQYKIIIDSNYKNQTVTIVYKYGDSNIVNKKVPYIRLLFNKVQVECCFANVSGLGSYSQNGWNDLKINGTNNIYIQPGSTSAKNYCRLQRYITVSWNTSEVNQLMVSQYNNNGHWYQAFFDTLDKNDIPTGFGYGSEHRVWSADQSKTTQQNIDLSKITIPPLNGTGKINNISINKYFKIGYSINFHGENEWKNASILSINGKYYNYNSLGFFEYSNISETLKTNNSSPVMTKHPSTTIWGENSRFYMTNSGKYISPANGVTINSNWETTDYCVTDSGCPCQYQCPCQCQGQCPCQEQDPVTDDRIYCQSKYSGGATGDRYFKQGGTFFPVGSQVFVPAGWYEVLAEGPIVSIGSNYNDYAKVYWYNTTGSDEIP